MLMHSVAYFAICFGEINFCFGIVNFFSNLIIRGGRIESTHTHTQTLTGQNFSHLELNYILSKFSNILDSLILCVCLCFFVCVKVYKHTFIKLSSLGSIL